MVVRELHPGDDRPLQEIADVLARSHKVLLVTGAGISTSCGIPVPIFDAHAVAVKPLTRRRISVPRTDSTTSSPNKHSCPLPRPPNLQRLQSIVRTPTSLTSHPRSPQPRRSPAGERLPALRQSSRDRTFLMRAYSNMQLRQPFSTSSLLPCVKRYATRYSLRARPTSSSGFFAMVVG